MFTFDASLATGNIADHITLAEQIAKFIQADMSEPQATNRDAWESDRALRELEKTIGYDRGQWDLYYHICGRAFQLVADPPGAALLLLAELNGYRRSENPNALVMEAVIGASKRLIETLHNGSRKGRLSTLLVYHVGIWYERTGDYLLAAQNQDDARALAAAAGDTVGASIAALCAAVARFNDVVGKREGILELNILDEAAQDVVETCTGNDETQIRWRHYNAPANVLLGHIWQNVRLPQRDILFWMDLLTQEVPGNMAFEKRKPLITAIRAGIAYLRNKRLKAWKLASEVVTDVPCPPDNQALMTAHLIFARFAGHDHLRIIAKQGHDMHQLRRLAQSVLNGEQSLT